MDNVQFYAIYNTDTYLIEKIAPTNNVEKEDPDVDYIYVPIESELAQQFFDGKENPFNWVLTLNDKDEWEVARKAEVAQRIIARINSAAFHQINVNESTTPEASLCLDVKNNIARLEINTKIISKAALLDLPKILPKGSIDFYVTAKGDPSALLDILSFSLDRLLQQPVVPWKHDVTEVSIFTRKTFNTYTLSIEDTGATND